MMDRMINVGYRIIMRDIEWLGEWSDVLDRMKSMRLVMVIVARLIRYGWYLSIRLFMMLAWSVLLTSMSFGLIYMDR